MALKQPNIDAPLAEWEAYDTELHYRAWIQPYSIEPNYLLTRDQEANAKK